MTPWWNRLQRVGDMLVGFLPAEPEDVERWAPIALGPSYMVANVNARPIWATISEVTFHDGVEA